ncbi:hypothetical protein Psi01_44060 [Planobispora siamensis]|uniref:Uncharacterized protein n=1 Tax=Planobispora siamensis TaxID=936338 RepID=A0A8J3SFR9_9ACTN|nr:hypothetical protein Psi01_44060 [Planobispora siamensis]
MVQVFCSDTFSLSRVAALYRSIESMQPHTAHSARLHIPSAVDLPTEEAGPAVMGGPSALIPEPECPHRR